MGRLWGTELVSFGARHRAVFGSQQGPKVFLQECQFRCRFFVSFSPAAGANEAPRTLVGAEAVLQLVGLAEAKRVAGEALVYTDVSAAIAFAWLLDDAGRKRVLAITKVATAIVDDDADVVSVSEPGAVPRKEHSKQMVANLFKKIKVEG